MNIQEIHDYLQANFTALMVTTTEYHRFAGALRHAVTPREEAFQVIERQEAGGSVPREELDAALEEVAAGKRVMEWTAVRGLREIGEPDSAETRSPERCVAEIRNVVASMVKESQTVEAAYTKLLVACERLGREPTEEELDKLPARTIPPTIFLLKDFQPYMKIPLVCEGLVDAAVMAQAESAWIVVVSPRTEVPEELQNILTLLEFDLPDRDHMMWMINDLARKQDLGDVEDGDRMADALAGLTDNQASDALALAFTRNDRLDVAEVLEEKTRSLSQAETGMDVVDTAEALTLDELKGIDVLAEWMYRRLDALVDDEARAFGLPVPKGPLLVGPPGVGKTAVAKAAGAARDLPVIIANLGEMYDSKVGGTERNVAAFFRLVKTMAPVLVLLDELEKLASMSMGSNSGDSGTSARANATLLTQLNEMKEPVFVIGTVNDVTAMRPEMLRKGRWGDVFLLDLPGLEARKAIFGVHLQRKDRDPEDFDLDELAAESEGFSGAEIEGAVISALFDAFYDGKREVRQEDLRKGVRDTAPLSKTAEEEIEAMRSIKGVRMAGIVEEPPKARKKAGGRFDRIRN